MTEQSFSEKVCEKFGQFDCGKFGLTTDKKALEIFFDVEELNDELGKNFNKEQAVDYVCLMLKGWQERVLSHNNFFVNYFLFKMIESEIENTGHFWENYVIDKNYDDNKCSEMFLKIATPEFVQSLDKYLEKDTKLDLGEVIKDKFKFFDYDRFLSGIKVEYVSITVDNELSIQLSDKYQSAFCGAYEIFDENLDGYDWHNF